MTNDEHRLLLADVCSAGYFPVPKKHHSVWDARWLLEVYKIVAVRMFYAADRTPLSERLRIAIHDVMEKLELTVL